MAGLPEVSELWPDCPQGNGLWPDCPQVVSAFTNFFTIADDFAKLMASGNRAAEL